RHTSGLTPTPRTFLVRALARHWCHRLAHATLGRPHPGRNALEPLVNIARLRIRAGDGTTAWTILETLHQAVTDQATVTTDGITIDTAALTATATEHAELRQWTWTVLLGTGAHALATANRWDDARQRLEHHHGIGHRMLDGRQIAVISHALAGRHHDAAELLRTTTPGEPWENAVTIVLNLLCTTTTGGHDASPFPPGHVRSPGMEVFWTRHDLSIIDALGIDHPTTKAVANDLLLRTTDGYAAREVLAHTGCHRLAGNRRRQRLLAVVNDCGLDRGHIPTTGLTRINQLLDAAESAIRHPSDPSAPHSSLTGSAAR
ncbi:hypothetical protein, partial [Actinoplanes utahensis]|uniref:hypothetical protein n=2 Tax=Actinoplanes utahensis TaxID=1869 RepID=UPI0031EEEA7C